MTGAETIFSGATCFQYAEIKSHCTKSILALQKSFHHTKKRKRQQVKTFGFARQDFMAA
ncbi:MAG: hypothetical protein H7Z13_01920 [Ferruginibacter sp.]|nr:hypothetical protein [Ferruginibacter sp.]